MRPQQQNRRMRGRGNGGNNNNRKGPNPLTRSYESNGPDVKIRGTAQQIAEKYTTLARDAQSSGDRVIGENYLQHAEHYNRLIAAALQQQQQNLRETREDSDEDPDERDDREEQETSGLSHNQQRQHERPQHERPQPERARYNDGTGPQPVIDGLPAEVALKDRQVDSNGNGSKPNGRGNGRGRTNAGANGRSEGHEPVEARREAEAAPKDNAVTGESAAGQDGSVETAPPPVKRTRRPRAKKADAAAAAANGAGEAPLPEEVAGSN